MAGSLVLPIQTILIFTVSRSLPARGQHDRCAKRDFVANTVFSDGGMNVGVDFRPLLGRHALEHWAEGHRNGLRILPEVFRSSGPHPGHGPDLIYGVVKSCLSQQG